MTESKGTNSIHTRMMFARAAADKKKGTGE